MYPDGKICRLGPVPSIRISYSEPSIENPTTIALETQNEVNALKRIDWSTFSHEDALASELSVFKKIRAVIVETIDFLNNEEIVQSHKMQISTSLKCKRVLQFALPNNPNPVIAILSCTRHTSFGDMTWKSGVDTTKGVSNSFSLSVKIQGLSKKDAPWMRPLFVKILGKK